LTTMAIIDKYFRLARQVALKGDTLEANRHYRLGAVGIRTDGAIVTASNIPNRQPESHAHAETRLVRKLDWGSTVYVVRIRRDGQLALARPCRRCQSAMRLRGVRYCYYSINDTEYGVIANATL
jgi:cytidine deaminase